MTERSERGGSHRDDRGGHGERRDRDGEHGYRRGSGGGDRGYRGGAGGGRGGAGRGGDRGHRGSDRGYRDRERGRSRRVYDDEPRDGLLADLVGHLHALDGRSYAAYKAIVGRYRAPAGWFLHIDRVQSDPYAPPTRIRVTMPVDLPGTKVLADEGLLGTGDRRLAVADFLTRELYAAFRGTALSIASPGQEILERSSVVFLDPRGAAVTPTDPGTGSQDGRGPGGAGPHATATSQPGGPHSGVGPRPDTADGPGEPAAETIEIRARMALPAQGRSIRGREASRIVSWDLPRAVERILDLTGERARRLLEHVAALEDHRALTRAVEASGWVSFLADGSLLPRRSGVSDEPLRTGALPLQAPDSLAATVQLPHAGTVRGTALGAGVTVIVGGGYHGKSTLLSAIERGVYPHVPGDGRELVATLPDAVKVRAADGRAITGVDLSAFISHLPGGQDTESFSTGNASGSTSQAASMIEAVEAGATALLLDEDTSATNLLIRDRRMRSLVAAEREPITPFVDRVGALAEAGVSTVMVMGGSGDYLDVADRVLLMDAYHLRDATQEAGHVVADQPREVTALPGFPWPVGRVPRPAPARTRRGPVRTRARGTEVLTLDREEIDVRDVAGLVDPGQAQAAAYALRALLEQRFDAHATLAQCLEDLDALLDDEGLDALGDVGERPAFLVRPRAVDVAAAMNRYRALELETSPRVPTPSTPEDVGRSAR